MVGTSLKINIEDDEFLIFCFVPDEASPQALSTVKAKCGAPSGSQLRFACAVQYSRFCFCPFVVASAIFISFPFQFFGGLSLVDEHGSRWRHRSSK